MTKRPVHPAWMYHSVMAAAANVFVEEGGRERERAEDEPTHLHAHKHTNTKQHTHTCTSMLTFKTSKVNFPLACHRGDHGWKAAIRKHGWLWPVTDVEYQSCTH